MLAHTPLSHVQADGDDPATPPPAAQEEIRLFAERFMQKYSIGTDAKKQTTYTEKNAYMQHYRNGYMIRLKESFL